MAQRVDSAEISITNCLIIKTVQRDVSVKNYAR